MRNEKRLFCGSYIIFALVVLSLVASAFLIQNQGQKEEAKGVVTREEISRANHEKTEDCTYSHIVTVPYFRVPYITIFRSEGTERNTHFPEDFLEIDRTPKFRIQAARSKIPDFRTNV